MCREILKRATSGLAMLAWSGLAAAQEADRGLLGGAELWEPLLRMLGSLLLVLAILAACTWLARRMRRGGAFQGGLIQIVSGLSLGGREKVVLLRVGEEDVLVGISPAGMTALHVLHGKPEPKRFDEFMEQTQALERRT